MYAAAGLARLGRQGVAVEGRAELIAASRQADTGGAIRWVEGPLAEGAPKAAPFDRILIEGAIDGLPQVIADQLAEGGRLVAARRDGAVARLVQGVKTGGTVVQIGRAHVCTPVTNAHLVCRL